MIFVTREIFQQRKWIKVLLGELEANLNVLHSYLDLINGTIMKHWADNSIAVSIILSGSKKPDS